jgi:hypothetical protein
MKRIATILIATASLIGLVALPASAKIPLPGTNCSFSVQYPPDPNTTAMSFSNVNRLWQTPVVRAGGCGHVFVESLGVNAAPPCFIARIRTYNENWTVNYDGPYMRWDYVGQDRDIRNGYVSNNRLYRIFAVSCDARYRDAVHPPGFNVYSRRT